MDKTVKVSIIIPFYNVGKYFRQCLESVVNQTLSEIEIILINDGSTDNSITIAHDFSLRYSFIKIIEQSNKGQGSARNKGIDIAKGKYVYFLDSDDYIEHDAMENLYKEADKDNLDLIIFQGISFLDKEFENSQKHKENKNAYQRKHDYPTIVSGDECFANLIYNNEYSCSPCLLFINKSILENYGTRFPEGIIHEDELFTLELMFKCRRVKCTNKTYFHRRLRIGSTTTGSYNLKSFIGCSIVLFKMMEFAQGESFKNKYIEKALFIVMSYIFGNAIAKSCYISSQDRKLNIEIITKLKNIADNMNYFDRIDYRLFCFNSYIYKYLRFILIKIKYNIYYRIGE